MIELIQGSIIYFKIFVKDSEPPLKLTFDYINSFTKIPL